MEVDSSNQENDEEYKQRKNINALSYGKYVFPTIWLRRPFCYCNEINRFILESGFNFLFYIGVISWVIFFIFW